MDKFVVQIGGKDLDLTNLPPLTLKDKRVLKSKNVAVDKIAEFTPEQEVMFIAYVIHKVDPSVTVEQIEDLPMRVATDIFLHVAKRTAEVGVNRPT